MLATKQEKLITSGEFAKLAQSTKRTIHWYTEHGLLKPKKINSKGYRFYSIEQIIDLQVIMLLRKLNFSLPEIKKFLRKNSSTKQLFLQKKQELVNEISLLQKKLNDISDFYDNLETEGIMVKPIIKTIPKFSSYTFEKTGPYAKIYDYGFELQTHFSKLPNMSKYFVIFPNREYAPKKDKMKIGVIVTKDIKLKTNSLVQKEIIPSLKVLHYKHIGPPALISMIIMQMHQYMQKHHLKQNLNVPINEIEFYSNSKLNGNHDENTVICEINIPIK